MFCLNVPMIITLSVLGLASILFISGKVRSDLVAVGALLMLLLLGVLTPEEALSGFSNSVVIMMIGLFVVGGGIFQTGLAKMASSKLLRLAGTSETRLLITVMLVTSFFGAFVSNTGTVAVMLPILVSLALSAKVNPSRLLMPLAFASSLGGMLTLIGTPPNLVVRDTLLGAGYEGVSFFAFTPVGLICVVVGLISMLFLRKYLPANEQNSDDEKEKSSLQKLAKQYQLAQNLYRVQVKPASPICEKTLDELDISSKYDINILEIRRKTSVKNQFFKTIDQEVAGSKTVIQAGDILYVHGSYERAKAFAQDYRLTMLDHHAQEMQSADNRYVTGEIGIAEALLTPSSVLLNRLVKETGFREKFNINIIGIKRKDKYILHHLKDEKLQFGDAILVQGRWKDIALLANERDDIVVVGQPYEESRKVTLDHKAPIAAGIMLLMIVLMVTEWIPAAASVMLAALLMVIFGCVRSMEDAYRTINWESIVLIAAMIPMSAAIEKTGAASLLSDGLVQMLGSYGPIALLAGIYLATSVLTLFISNTACAVLLAPIALNASMQLGVSPVPFLIAVAVAASMCFASPFSTPPNALVMSAGGYKFTHYLKVGLPLQIVIGVIMVAALPLLFPF